MLFLGEFHFVSDLCGKAEWGQFFQWGQFFLAGSKKKMCSFCGVHFGSFGSVRRRFKMSIKMKVKTSSKIGGF